MFHDVDRALVSLLKHDVIGDAAVQVSLEPPNRPWVAALRAVTINLFLYDVRENVARREVMYTPVVDENGVVVGKRPPVRRYDLYYVVSVWTPRIELEHQVLAAVAAGLAGHETVPAAHLPPALQEQEGQLLLGVAAGLRRGMLPTFGGEMKLQLELVVTVPLPARVDLPAAPPVVQPLSLAVTGPQQQETVSGPVPGQRMSSPAPAGAAGVSPQQQREQLAQAVEAAPAGGPPPAAAQQPGGPADPFAQVRAALSAAAQVQAALAQAQAGLARMLAGPPAAAPQPAAPAPPAAAAPPTSPSSAAPSGS